MKNFIGILILIMVIIVSCQGQKTATYDDVITKKVKGFIEQYTTNNGEVFCVGDTIKLGVPSNNENFDFMMQNAGVAYYPLTNLASGSEVKIKKIRIQSKMVQVSTTKPVGHVYGIWINNFEEAINQGEIKTSFLTSQEALQQLKNEKDKLELGLITEEEYNKRKEKLIKYIK